MLRKSAEQEKVALPKDVALYIAQNLRLNESALQGALLRLIAHSSLTGTEIALNYTRHVLKNFIDAQTRKVNPLQRLLSQQFGTKEAKVNRRDPIAAGNHFVFCWLKIRDGRRASRARRQLEVNMREGERERLARWDAYERALERLAKKRKQQ